MNQFKFRWRFLLFSLLGFILSTILLLGMGQAQVVTEFGSRQVASKAAHTQKYMVAAAHPIAARVGGDILKQGGNAIDAAIATQLVLGLVEPNASGIGGGSFLVYYDAKTKQVHTYDGREIAPASARSERFLGKDDKPLEFYDGVIGGKSVGVPGTVRMLGMTHKAHGRLPWRQLVQPVIRIARQGFPIAPRLHALLSNEKYLLNQENAKRYFYRANGTPKPVGTILVNLAYADVMQQIANSGADAFYHGAIAKDIVKTIQHAKVPGDLTTEDLANYQPIERSPVCGTYRVYKVCSMGPPSSGGITILQMLGILDRFPLANLKPTSTAAIHLFTEAGRLAYADRSLYIADPNFVSIPIKELINPEYLKKRSELIKQDRAMTGAQPGKPSAVSSSVLGKDNSLEFPSTSHISIIDRYGNAVAMTSSIEDNFGSRLMVRGFLLNNQLTDFSFSPTTKDGKLIANRVEPGKRPRSSMAPTLVFNRQGKLVMAIGSAGGSRIINYVTKALMAVLDWKLDPQQAIAMPNFGNRDNTVELEAQTSITELKPSLQALGHAVVESEQISGSHAILVTNRELFGGADPRRDGMAIGK
jgi:gamma-glutamyltranspeptidase / glutathione hydrolase